jgi:hypothetical protein
MTKLKNYTDDEYFAHPAVNRSTLWNMRKSAFHTQTKLPRTDALDYGTAAHLILLEDADDKVTFWDGPDRRSKKGKEAYAKFEQENIDNERIVLKKQDYFDVMYLIEAVRKHAVANSLLGTGGQKEVTAIWERKGVELKAKYDYLDLTNKFAADFKTTQDASYKGFERSVYNFGYYFQAAFYFDAFPELERFYFICAEKKTNAVAVYHIDRDSTYIDYGITQMYQWLEDYSIADISGYWAGYTDEYSKELETPYWLREAAE